MGQDKDGVGVSRRELLTVAGIAGAALAAPAAATPGVGSRLLLFAHIGVLVGDKVREDAGLLIVGGRIAAIGDTLRLAELGKPKSSLKPRAIVAERCAWQLTSPGRTTLPRPS